MTGSAKPSPQSSNFSTMPSSMKPNSSATSPSISLATSLQGVFWRSIRLDAARTAKSTTKHYRISLNDIKRKGHMADLGYDNKVAIITGSGGGLGREHALLLASRGARIVVNDLGGAVDGSGSDATTAQVVVNEIEAAGGIAIADHNSVATPEGGAAIVQTALDAFERIDIVINNAGILRDKTFQKMTDDFLTPVIDVHLKGAFYVTQPAWPHMREQGYGRVVNTSSSSGILGNFGQTTYGCSQDGSRSVCTRPLAAVKAFIDLHCLAATVD